MLNLNEILQLPFTTMNCKTLLSVKMEKSKGKHLNLCMKIYKTNSDESSTSAAPTPALCSRISVQAPFGEGSSRLHQVFSLLPNRWSHLQRPIGPGKEIGSCTSTGKAADGNVKNIPRERQHPLQHRIVERSTALHSLPSATCSGHWKKGKAFPKWEQQGEAAKLCSELGCTHGKQRTEPCSRRSWCASGPSELWSNSTFWSHLHLTSLQTRNSCSWWN